MTLKCKVAIIIIAVSENWVFRSRIVREYGGIGRRARFRFWWLTAVQVQVLLLAPNKNKTNLDENSKFVLFFTRDYFGLKIKL